MKIKKNISLDYNSYLEFEKIGIGAFNPLQGFMDEKNFYSVVENMRLINGTIFPIPVIFAIKEEEKKNIKMLDQIDLIFNEEVVGNINIKDIYKPKLEKVLPRLFGTKDKAHPGYKMINSGGSYFIGGDINFIKKVSNPLSIFELSPSDVKMEKKKRGFKTLAGFQTRNIPHRAHEFIHKMVLEKVDGLFIQPLLGRKRIGDFSPSAIMNSYKFLINNYLPKKRVMLGSLSTSMRYAGPREAVFHAIIRKNYGCTHFVVGRDHAGVKNYYKTYEAQELCRKLENELGIDIIYAREPYYCKKCGGIVTDNICPHSLKKSNFTFEISGTKVRSMISGNENIDENYIRKDIVKAIDIKSAFIKEED